MIENTQAPNRRVRRYFQQAANLRLALQDNLDDYTFSTQQGHLIYLMDANIVRFFMNPSREVDHIAAFGSGSGDDYLVATSLIAAEYLFSRALAGQEDTPALISPSHADDLHDIISGIRSASSSRDTNEPAPEIANKTRLKLEELVRRVETGQLPRAEAVATLRREIPDLAGIILEGGIQEAGQLLRLYNEDLLRPLALHPDATAEIMRVSYDSDKEVRDWAKRIEAERRPSRKEGNWKIRVRRDAEVLVQVLRLNASVGSSAATRYVLITADRALFDAYAKWYWSSLDGGSDGGFFTLRRPLQYAPILNVGEMPNGISESDVIERARDALDSLFANLRAVDPRYPRTLSIHRILASLADESDGFREALEGLYGFDPLRFSESDASMFESIRTEWEESFRDGIVLNAELMSRRAKAEFGRLAALLREDIDLRAAVHADQQRLIDQVEAAHLAINTKINVELLVDRHRAGRPSRARMMLRATFPRLLGNADFEDVLAQLASGDSSLAGALNKAIEETGDCNAFFFAACLAQRCGYWNAAWHYSGRALSLATQAHLDDWEYQEIVYLHASATRFSLPSGYAVARSLEMLDASIESCRKRNDTFGVARALCEHDALILFVLYCRRFLPGGANALRGKEIDRGISRVPENLGRAMAETSRVRVGPEWRLRPEDVEMLEIQSCANVISAELFLHFLQGEIDLGWPSPVSREVDTAFSALTLKFKSANVSLVLLAEHAILGYLTERVEQEEAIEVLRLVEDKIAAGHSVTQLDKAELVHFKNLLMGASAVNELVGQT